MYLERGERSWIFRKTERSFFSFLLSLLLLFSALGGVQAQAENSTQAQTEGKIKMGKLRVLFEENTDLVTLDVLYREATDTLWIDPEEFVGNLLYYSYEYQPEKKTAVIRTRRRQIAFQVGSAETAYKVGDCECFYRMKEKVISWQNRVWIPADAFFYYLCCCIHPVSADGDRSTWEPQSDFVLIRNPGYTVLDVLQDIFAMDCGLYWSFDFRKDFGFDDESIEKLYSTSNMAYKTYEAATGNIYRTIDLLVDLGITVLNKQVEELNAAFGTEISATPNYLDEYLDTELFLKAILGVSSDQMAGAREDIGELADLSSLISEHIIAEGGSRAIEASNTEMIKLFQAMEPDSIWPVFQNNFDELNRLSSQSANAANAAGNVLTVGVKGLQVYLTAAGIIQEMRNLDDVVTEAIERYLDASKQDTVLASGFRTAVEKNFASMKDKMKYAASEAVKEGINTQLPGLLEKAAGMQAYSIVTSVTNISWFLMEKSGLTSLLSMAEVSSTEACQVLAEALLYQNDAFRELIAYFDDIVLENNLSDAAQLRECAYLALNYLQACYVSVEAGMGAMKGSDFEDNENYKKAESKRRRVAEMISGLRNGILLDNSIGYGVPLTVSGYGEENEMTFEQFAFPMAAEDGQSYHYKAELLSETHLELLPLVYFCPEKNANLMNGGYMAENERYLLYTVWPMELFQELYLLDKESGNIQFLYGEEGESRISHLNLVEDQVYFISYDFDISEIVKIDLDTWQQTVLYSSANDDISYLEVYGDYCYFSDGLGIQRIHTQGGDYALLREISGGFNNPFCIMEDTIYYVEPEQFVNGGYYLGTVKTVHTDGTDSSVSPGLTDICTVHISTDGEWLYFISFWEGKTAYYRCRPDGTECSFLADADPMFTHLNYEYGTYYLADQEGLKKFDPSQDPWTELAQGNYSCDISLSDGWIYYVSSIKTSEMWILKMKKIRTDGSEALEIG